MADDRKVENIGVRVPRSHWRKPLHHMSFSEAVSILSGSFDPRDRLPVIAGLFPDIAQRKTMPTPPPMENRRLGMLWNEFHQDNNRVFSLFALDGLRLSQRYVEGIMRAMQRGEDVPPHIIAEARKTDYFNQKTQEELEKQKKAIAKLLGDEDLDIERLEENLPRIIDFLKLARASGDKKISAEADAILNAIIQRKSHDNDHDHGGPSQSGPRP